MESPKFVYVTFIRTTPEKLWDAITRSEFTQVYWSGVRFKTDWKVGSLVQLTDREGAVANEGKVLRCEPPRVLSYTWEKVFKPEFRGERASRITFEIEPEQEGQVKLTVTHDEFDAGSKVYEGIRQGWPKILASLKTLLETGTELASADFTVRAHLAKV